MEKKNKVWLVLEPPYVSAYKHPSVCFYSYFCCIFLLISKNLKKKIDNSSDMLFASSLCGCFYG